MGKMLKNEVAKNELKEVRHSEEWHKSGEKVKYRLADAMKSCMKKAPVEKITVKEITEECGEVGRTKNSFLGISPRAPGRVTTNRGLPGWSKRGL